MQNYARFKHHTSSIVLESLEHYCSMPTMATKEKVKVIHTEISHNNTGV